MSETPREIFAALLAEVAADPYNCADIRDSEAEWLARFDAAEEMASKSREQAVANSFASVIGSLRRLWLRSGDG